MNMKKMLLLVLVNTYLFGLGTCQMKNEYQNASISNETRTVIDYTDKIQSPDSVNIYDNWSYTGSYADTTCNNGTISVHAHGGSTLSVSQYNGEWAVWNDNAHYYAFCYYTSYGSTKYCRTSYNTSDQYEVGYESRIENGLVQNRLRSCYKEVYPMICPTGYTDNGTNCKKTITYTYQNMTCDENDKNAQGYGWSLSSNAINDGLKTDENIHLENRTILEETIQSHESSDNLCVRQYQECSISCVAPLTLDVTTGQCVMDYATSCNEKGMVYNETLNICEKQNKCNNENALKDDDSDYCRLDVECNAINGVCAEEPIKSCENNDFNYLNSSNRCETSIACNENQIMLDNEMCGSLQYCRDDDTQTTTDCISTTQVQKNCSPDGRDGNLCYKLDSVENNMNIEYKKELQKVDTNGTFKSLEYGNLKNTYCTNDTNSSCTFRLTKIYTQNNGKELCFEDHIKSVGCIKLEGECTLEGEVISENGIRQLFIENNNHDIVAYNKAIQDGSLGSIHATCSLSGKVGSLNEPDNNKEIISVKGDGSDIKFWDSYKRGDIGVITFLPTIPEEDINEGYEYEDPEIMELYKNNYTGFYTNNGKTYAVHNGLIPRSQCSADIYGTSFYIPQAENVEEENILNMLSLLSRGEYNFNNGDDTNGTCVIASSSAKSFNQQSYSIKRVSIDNGNSKYICSPLTCKNHYCQENRCQTGFIGNEIETSELEQFVRDYFPNLTIEDICTDETCDSNKPYFPYCGNNSSCSESPDVFQQEDGKCVTISCENSDSFDYSTNQCSKLECVDSVEVDGKCIKTLN